jgi:hypothetical protein
MSDFYDDPGPDWEHSGSDIIAQLQTPMVPAVIEDELGDPFERFRPVRLDPNAPPPPPPTMVWLTKPGGEKDYALFCEGDTYLITGIQESGKSWLAAVCAIEWIKAGKTVWWFDPDGMGQARLIERLRLFGITDEQMNNQVIYSPADLSQVSLAEYGGQMAEWAREFKPDLFIVDSWGPSLGVVGLDQHQADDIQAWWRAFVVPVRNECQKMTTIILDHQPKNDSDNQVKGVYGSQRKLSVVDWGLSMKSTDKMGHFAIRKLKQRGTQWEPWQDKSLQLEVHGTGWEITMPEPTAETEERLKSVAGKISWVMKQADEPLSRRKVILAYRTDGGQADDRRINDALNFLVEGGYVTDEGPLIQNKYPSYEWVKRYPPVEQDEQRGTTQPLKSKPTGLTSDEDFPF